MENRNEINLKEKYLEEIINIGFEGKTKTEQMLSNLAHTPFELHGQIYESVEAFWQGLKFPDEKKREEIAQLWGIEAKKTGRKAPKVTEFEYQGEKFKVGSKEHQNLMKQALKAKFEQNPQALNLLLATGKKKVTHILINPQNGFVHPDSQTIPGKTFCGFLMELREEFRGK